MVDRNDLQSCLQSIHEKIKLDAQESRKHQNIVDQVLFQMVQTMWETDSVFKMLYCGAFMTGSFYEGTRIKEPTEFDINLVLDFRIPASCREIQRDRKVGGYCKYVLKRDGRIFLQNGNCAREVLRFFDGDKLNAESVIKWFQANVDRVLSKIQHEQVEKITLSQSGPAKTLLIFTTDQKKIDVDLVPVLKFYWPEWPHWMLKNEQLINSTPEEERFWFIVPKLYNPDETGSKVNRDMIKYLWRVHFPRVEANILEGKECAKPVIKLLKFTRDQQRWSLSSYCLKTLVISHILKYPSEEYWGTAKEGERFTDILTELQKAVTDGCIPYLFSRKLNLLAGKSNDERTNIRRRIARLLNSLSTSPESFYELNCKQL